MSRLHFVLVGCVVAGMSATQAFATTTLQAVAFTRVKIEDRFWAPRIETNRTVSIPHSFKMLEKVGNIHDLELAAKGAREGYRGPVFIDSDLYKAVEAAAYSLATVRDPKIEEPLDAIIAKIAAAQQPDGYLNTWFTVNAPDKRFTNLRDQHELYCAGHLFEAAVAHYQATGKRTLLDVAVRFAEYLYSVFGSDISKRMGYCGHPEIELALIKLARVTGEQRYFELARFFLDSRGSKFFAQEHKIDLAKYDGVYLQDNVPLREHKKIVGHAVRAAYLMSGATDLAAATGDAGLLKMLDRVWRNTTECNMYITGGIGSSAHNEGFTVDYDLPNLTAYQETCASVALAIWAHRMNLLHGDAKYGDVMERALYNGFLASVSLDGTRFFYVNPLASKGDHHRKEWYDCACCPPNVTRTLAQLGGYAYAVDPKALWVNLYAQGSAQTEIAGTSVTLDVKTDYPWNGDVEISPSVASPAKFELRLRVPEWCEGAKVSVNGAAESPRREKGYFVLDRTWAKGDRVQLELPMPVRRVAAHPEVREDAGRLAVQRGPLVYCIEDADNKRPVSRIAVAADERFESVAADGLPAGTVVLKTRGTVQPDAAWKGRLYATAAAGEQVEVTAIPYCLWDNRKAGVMAVWLPVK